MNTDNLSRFNYVRNRNKLFANLLSIIDGIVSDGKLSEDELLFLDTWLLEAKAIQENVIFDQIREQIIDIKFDGKITQSELAELKDTLITIQQSILDLPNIDLYSKESDIHLLSGLCKGIIADGHLNDQEISYLKWWLDQNALLKNNYPGKELYQFIYKIFEDKTITDEERIQLKSLLIEFTGSDPESGIVDGLSIGKSFFDSVDDLDISHSTICFTGKFLFGSRNKCKELAKEYGCTIIDNWRSDLDYLIIGSLNSRDWMYQSFGRKIETAKEYQDQGHHIKIITEEQWLKAIKKTS